MAEVTTPAEALAFLRRNAGNMNGGDLQGLADLAEAHAAHYLEGAGISVCYSDREIIAEFNSRGLDFPGQDDCDEALAAIRGGDFQRATYLLERNASWAGKCSASAAWTNAGRPECGRLL